MLLKELVAAVVVHSSAAASSHLGVPIEPRAVERPPVSERTVARTPPAKSVKAPERVRSDRA